jgi:predicted ribosomally synthesized peptide with nif11-like leader
VDGGFSSFECDNPIEGDRVDRRTGMIIEKLLEDLKGDKLADKFQGCESIDEFVATARELGYDIDAEEAERASDFSDELLEGIAGGGGFIDPTIVEYTTC